MEGKRKRRSSDSVYAGNINNSVKEFEKQEKKIRKMEDEHKERPELPKEDPNVPLIRPVAEKEENFLDLVFAMDCTSSMSPYIDSAKNNVRKIVEEIISSEQSDVRLALVQYRDHPPQDKSFVTKVNDFTFSHKKMRDWLDNCEAKGGGDIPEAVTDALNDVLKLTWRTDSIKICVVVSDAPPHGINCASDGFPNGCPDGLDPIEITRRMAKEGITLYSVGCEPQISPYKEFFMGLAFITGGQYVPLTAAKLLSDVIIGGAQEEISLEAIMAEVDKEVKEEMATGKAIESSLFSAKVHTKLQSKGIATKQLLRNDAELETAADSPVAKKISTANNLEEVRKFYKPQMDRSRYGRGYGSGLFSFGGSSGSATFGSSGGLFGGGGAAGFGSASGTGSSLFSAKYTGPSNDTYGSATNDISYAQTSRLVMKSVARNNATLKKE